MKTNLGRIKGLWRAIRVKSKFACNFLMNPNQHAIEADVVVATSIIGAGFSIDVRFVSFHAFLSCDILDHWMQRQLIQRLRCILKMYNGETATPIESYLYMEKGRGEVIKGTQILMEQLLEGFNKIRADIVHRTIENNDLLTQTGHYLDALEDTQAASAAREYVTRQKNPSLWIKYGKEDLSSKFDPMRDDVTKEEENYIKARMIEFVKEFRNDIAGHLMVKMAKDRLDDLDADEAMEMIESLDESNIREIMVSAATDHVFSQWKKSVLSTSVAIDLLKQKHAGGDAVKLKREVKNINGQSVALLTKLQRLACWICYAYSKIGTMEEGKLVFATFMRRRMNTTACRNAAGLILAARLVPIALGGYNKYVKCSAVIETGTCPFYTEALFIKQHDGWADFWRDCFVVKGDDDDILKGWKADNCHHLGLIKVESVNGDLDKILEKLRIPYSKLGQQTDRPKKEAGYPAYALFQQLCRHMGLDPKSTHTDMRVPKHRCPDNAMRAPYRITLSPYDFALMLLIRKPFVDRVKCMLPELLCTNNLDEIHKHFGRLAITKLNEAIDHMTEDHPSDNTDGSGAGTDQSDDQLRVSITKERARGLYVRVPDHLPDTDELPISAYRQQEIKHADKVENAQDKQRQSLATQSSVLPRQTAVAQVNRINIAHRASIAARQARAAAALQTDNDEEHEFTGDYDEDMSQASCRSQATRNSAATESTFHMSNMSLDSRRRQRSNKRRRRD